MSPDRIVLGGIDARTLDALEELYQVFEGVDKIRTTPKTAEMIKYTSNALLATMISFSNEIGNLCTGLGDIDVVDVMRAVHLDKRLCPILPDGRRIVPQFTTYIEAGCGFGGSCFPKDVKALIAHGKKAQQPMALLQSVIQVNEQQPRQIIEILNKQFRSLKGIRLAILGLAFKPGTDDMRESPAIPIVNELAAAGASMRAFDPVAKTEAEKILGTRQITYCEQLSDALDGADAVVLLTRWDEFAKLPELLADREPQPLVVDGRRMIDKKKLRRYTGIGI
jgi:UDPglucose 6-dehydrogenase/GDP-mannose 6-dehydrogenase